MKESGQDDSGLRRILSIWNLYEFFQGLLGGRNARKWVVKNVWKIRGREKIVDIGCGPATILKYLPHDVEYLGFDISENYIRAARKRFSGRGTFLLGSAHDFLNHLDDRFTGADLVLCNGLLHHLSDEEASEVLELSKRIMKSNGRLVCIEATFLARQTRLSKWIVSTDRGRFVRSEEQWKDLISRAFDIHSTSILTGLIRIPYTHILIECMKGRSSDEKRKHLE